MRSVIPAGIMVLSILARLCSATGMVADSVKVGQNLQTVATVDLQGAVPEGGLLISVTSDEPSRLLLSNTPEGAGAPAIAIPLGAGFHGSVEFYVHGLASSGKVTYTVRAPGLTSITGTVTLAPSGIVFAGPTTGFPGMRMTKGAVKPQINVYSAVLDASLNYIARQLVAGGRPVSADVTSSNPRVGKVTPSQVTIAGGSYSAATQFEPVGLGDTTLAITPPQGFSKPANFGSIPLTVVTPGIAIANGMAIGKDLEIEWVVNLGEPAPPQGITVTLTSGDPRKLLLAPTATAPGSPSIQIAIPAGGVSAPYYLQALADSGTVTHSASAPGFLGRVGTINLAPSGVVMGGEQGPPDEAELFRKDVAEGPHGFVASLAAARVTPVHIYMVQLDPVTHRGADLTVQPLRAGLSLVVTLKNTNPNVGKIAESQLTIQGGEAMKFTPFTPLTLGATEISVITPSGFMQAANSTLLSVKVIP